MPTLNGLRAELSRLVDPADPTQRKSVDLTLGLLAHEVSPWDRGGFMPGHITASALVLHPGDDAVLLIHHRGLRRWLLPGGHLEATDAGGAAAAAREAREETGVVLRPDPTPRLVRVDVHGIPPRKGEPYHLHHDLAFCFLAVEATLRPERQEVADAVWSPFQEAFALHPEPHLHPDFLRRLRDRP